MITVIPRKITATSVNGVTVANDGSITLPVDNAPTTNSTNFVTSGGVKTELDALSVRIGNAENPAQVWTDVSFTIPTSSWSLSDNKYTAVVQSSSIYSTSGIFINYDDLDNAAAPITAEESTGQVTFTTDIIPTGTITGTFRIVDSVNGIVPIARGGTGAATEMVALTNLGAVAKAGDTMTGPLHITRENNFPELSFNRYNSPEDKTQCMIQPTLSSTTAIGFAFYQRLANSTAWEGFRLPSTTEVLTSGNVYYDILTTKPGTGSLYYAPGETYSTTPEMMMCGHITNGVRNIHLGLWLPKSLEKISNISITTLVGSIRGVNGYVGWTTTTDFLTQSGLTITANRTTPNGIRINIVSSSDLSNATANTPVTLSGRITLSFS